MGITYAAGEGWEERDEHDRENLYCFRESM